jgi:lysylphosphatidylglycerol synthetase-like protein (DUF2156 family)
MGDTWLKIKAWTKGILACLVVVYLVLFIFKNGGQNIHFWWWFGHNPEIDALYMALVAFFAGAICVILVQTTWRTVRQIRESKAERRMDKLEKQQADMRTKAAMLQTAPGVTVHVDQAGQ